MYATSDIDEAKFLSDKIAIIYGGVIEQYGTYDELRNKPLSRKVAEYFDDKIALRPSRVVGTAYDTLRRRQRYASRGQRGKTS